MNLPNLEDFFDVINLYLVLDDKKSLTSSQLKTIFFNTKTSTLYYRLDALAKQGHIKKIHRKQIGKKILPGGDQIEYLLTPSGVQTRNKLIKKALKVFQKVISQIIEHQIKKDQDITAPAFKDIQELDTQISENTSLEISEVLQDFLHTLITNKGNFSKEGSHEMVNNALKKIQSIYNKELEGLL